MPREPNPHHAADGACDRVGEWQDAICDGVENEQAVGGVNIITSNTLAL